MYIVLNENKYIMAMSETHLGDSIELELPEDFDYEHQSCYKYENDELVYDETKADDYDLNDLRAERINMLRAFDIYKTNVIYGIEEETHKEEILAWYKDILDLKEKAFNNIPEQIKKYI